MSKISDLVIRDQLSNARDVYKPIDSRSELNAYQDRVLAVKITGKLAGAHADMINQLWQVGKAEQATTWACGSTRLRLAIERLEVIEVEADR